MVVWELHHHDHFQTVFLRNYYLFHLSGLCNLKVVTWKKLLPKKIYSTCQFLLHVQFARTMLKNTNVFVVTAYFIMHLSTFRTSVFIRSMWLGFYRDSL
jgi:hypothetical protein